MTSRVVLGGLLTIGLLAAACSGGSTITEESPGSTSTTDTTTTTEGSLPSTSTSSTTTAAPTTTVPKLTPVAVDAADYRFEGIPDTAPVGTRFSLFNTSQAEFHEMIVYRLDPSEQRTIEELSQLPLDELTAFGVGRIQSVVFAMPESEQYTYAEGPPMLAEEGRYLIFCAINVGTDPIEARVLVADPPMAAIDGVPRHYQVGMMTEIIATG